MAKYFSGYIEGYYGKCLTWSQREILIKDIGASGLNTFVYAPKEDPYHRAAWREPYPQEYIKAFRALIKTSARAGVHFIPAIAPGLSFDYLDSRDYRILWRKIGKFLELGVRSVALLMDDIPNRLPANCLSRFPSLGQAHGELLKRLSGDIKKVAPRANLWFCPTEYADELVEESVAKSAYLDDLSHTCPLDVKILWTGSRVISATISPKNTAQIRSLFGGRIVFWDNYFANDYCPRKIFLGPYKGRSHKLLNYSSGMLLNPTGYFHTDRIYIKLLAAWMRGKSPHLSWKETLRELDIGRSFAELLKYMDSPFQKPLPKKISSTKLRRQLDLLEKIIFTWKGPLAQEWFAYLQGLRQDLSLRQKGKPPEYYASWMAKIPDSLRSLLNVP